MQNIHLFIDHLGSQYAPMNWTLDHAVKMQRLYYIKSGKGSYSVGHSAKEPFLPGHVYLFPYNAPVHFETDSLELVDHIFFDFLSTPAIISDKPVICDVPENSLLADAFFLAEKAILEFNDGDMFRMTTCKIPRIIHAPQGSFDEKRQILYRLLHLILLLLSNVVPIPYTTDEAVVTSLDYIHKNYNEPISVKDLCALVSLSENQFIRRFKNVMGKTPYAYLRSYRLLCAQELISSGHTITEASDMVGFALPNSLSRALKKQNPQKN